MKNDCHLFPYIREDVFSLQQVKQALGWEITTFDLPKKWKLSQGEGVKIAVIDTGCDLNHSDLKANLLPGKNFVERNKEPQDFNGHGSHVAGTICALNNDLGMAGVAPMAKVLPVKALGNDGSGNTKDVIDSVYWAADQKVDFITMSLGTPKSVPELEKAIKYALDKGAITFCAAGNAGNTKEIFYPAKYKDTIGIGSIDQNFNRANFSCTGNDLDFLAPGVRIFSTVPNNWYSYMSGTSMSNPFVVGCAALLLSYVRKNKANINLNTPDDYRNIFKKHTVSLKDPKFAGNKFFEGFGIINPKEFEKWING